MTRRALLVICAVLLAGAGSGCGYALAGRGSFLPSYIRVIGIPEFGNTTPYELVEQVLTERVRSEFIGRGNYTVLPERTGVDAVLTGEITGITIAPASFTQDQAASRYIISVIARLEFRDLKTNNVLWENPALVFREEYQATQGTDSLDPNAFFGQEADALERIAQEFARSVVSGILEAF
ncbi:MAG TPA: LPS assembly lipoprotein LptE [Vicinamibacterales bacterium]|nr:LPS assembly lipoprotein LptE [Vicinamibacterales bacterium]